MYSEIKPRPNQLCNSTYSIWSNEVSVGYTGYFRSTIPSKICGSASILGSNYQYNQSFLVFFLKQLFFLWVLTFFFKRFQLHYKLHNRFSPPFWYSVCWTRIDIFCFIFLWITFLCVTEDWHLCNGRFKCTQQCYQFSIQTEKE